MSQAPFRAYQGSEPYVFISYAHRDSERVFPIIQQMHAEGYRIWYDEGIEPGSEWPEEIATHLSDASAVLLFVSPRSMDSHNVRREVTFTINLRKLMVSVYLEPTEMSAGMSLQLGLNQAVHYYAYQTDSQFFEKLLPVLPIATRENTREAPFAADAPTSPVFNASPSLVQPEPELTSFEPALVRAEVPQRLEGREPQAPSLARTAAESRVDFSPSGMVLPFMPKGSVTVHMKNGGEAICPLNCFVVPRRDGNYDCICLNRSLKDKEQYLFGARGDSYRFEDMASIDVSEVDEGLTLVVYLKNGERRFFEKVASFEVGGLFGRSFRRYKMADISRITFDPNGVTEAAPDLALITTKSGVSFYTPIGMLETLQFAVSMGGAGYSRQAGFELEGTLLEYRKLSTLKVDIVVGGMYSDSDFTAHYTLRSGISESVSFKRHYTPQLSGVNQFGCFSLSFVQIERIDVYTSGREGMPSPTPLPEVTWPEPDVPAVPFYGEGRAVIINAAGTQYVCPANAVLGVDGHVTVAAYDGINTDITGEHVFELFKVSGLTKFEDIESVELSHAGGWGDEYPLRMRDTSGVTLQGEYSHADANAAPGLVFACGGEKGAVRFMALRSLAFDHDEEAPDVEQAVVYTRNGRAIGMPRGTVVFSGCGTNCYPGCCFMLPTGNAVDIGTLRRMMIHDQPTEDGTQRWIVFECDGLRGAFPLPSDLWKSYRLFGASEFGLCSLAAGDDWYLLDMKR